MRILAAVIAALLLGAAAMADDRGDALVQAARRGDRVAVERLLAAGAPIDARNGRGETALLVVTDAGHDALGEMLIARGADINAQAANSDTPWLLAGASGRTALLRAMLAHGGVDYARRNRYGGNALIPAAHHGHVETVKFLLEHSRIDVNHVNNLGWTALLEAVILGNGGAAHTEIVRLLVAHNANVDLADREGVTPLAHAERRGQRAIAAILRGAGAR